MEEGIFTIFCLELLHDKDLGVETLGEKKDCYNVLNNADGPHCDYSLLWWVGEVDHVALGRRHNGDGSIDVERHAVFWGVRKKGKR